MELINSILLILHIVCGYTALSFGAVVMFKKKGNVLHKRIGKIFYVSMLGVSFSAFYLSIVRDIPFLLYVGIFVLYQNYSGYRSIKNKGLNPSALDVVIVLGALVNAVIMLWTANPILIVFGSISLLLVYSDFRIYYLLWKKREIKKMTWLSRHIGMMVGAYIGAITAFLVVNIQTSAIPSWVVWLAPTALLVPLMRYWNWKYTVKKGSRIAKLGVVIGFMLSSLSGFAQPYVDGGNTRHRFAQLNVGLDFQMGFGGKTQFVDPMGLLQNLSMQPLSKPRVIMGGTHFWGHADFYVAFPLTRPSFTKQNQQVQYSTSVETVFKYYPLRIEHHKLRPFLGISLASIEYEQNNLNTTFSKGSLITKTILPLKLGLTYNSKNHLIDATVTHIYTNTIDYYVSRSVTTQIKTPPWYLAIGYKYMLETTASAESHWKSGKTKRLTDLLAEQNKLNDVFVGIGMSSAWWLNTSSYNQTERPYISDQSISVMPEFALGYYLHKPDLNLLFHYRSYSKLNDVYGTVQNLSRKSVGFEIIKHLFDYHGFTPFIGPVVSYDRLLVEETHDGATSLSQGHNKIAYGINLGWDIRPNRLQWFILRTNIRYYPNLAIDINPASSFSFDAIEFNFIQLILFPDRIF